MTQQYMRHKDGKNSGRIFTYRDFIPTVFVPRLLHVVLGPKIGPPGLKFRVTEYTTNSFNKLEGLKVKRMNRSPVALRERPNTLYLFYYIIYSSRHSVF